MAEMTNLPAAMSRAFRQGLAVLAAGRELRPNDLRLAYQLCLETFDLGVTFGRVELDRWARLLDLKDSKGFRPDKVASILNTLKDLGVVDVNAAQGTFEPRPDSTVWLRGRAMRPRALYASDTGDPGAVSSPAPGELPLRSERPLSEALSELSRETASSQGQSYSPNSPGATPLSSSDKSDDAQREAVGFRRINPTTPESAANTGDGVSSDKSDASRARAGRFETCTRFKEVQKTCTRSASDKSDEPEPRKRRLVQERVRAFVGQEDWARDGSWGGAYYVWNSAEAIDRLDRVLNYVLGGLKEKSIRVKRTPGACLWYYFGQQTEKETGLKRYKLAKKEAL